MMALLTSITALCGQCFNALGHIWQVLGFVLLNPPHTCLPDRSGGHCTHSFCLPESYHSLECFMKFVWNLSNMLYRTRAFKYYYNPSNVELFLVPRHVLTAKLLAVLFRRVT